ncbi:putative T7SS-secreted protein [Streptomyces prasinopilosus]|uniref:ADP-ribosyltransferase exoenzyme n=1 Tax=Streptomyces prasinopilosus TaxID=67344 RepID=A0A1G6P7N6_9ACTN|nr:ADP-ribosyltransferase [Streptomyces prasinopilosus]SDC76008.1 ADP-ribosyltransferase exoenzyme [Streptomyces prasinopilosus]
MGVLDDLGDDLGKLKDGLDSGLRIVEHGVDAGKRVVGEGVDWGTDRLGEGLDRVGLKGAADAVEDWGDELASDLGATPGEQQLGQTGEAGELVHGNPERIRSSAAHLRDFSTAFDKVGSGMKKVDSSRWRGEGGDTFREKFGVHPAKWLRAADACETAAGALESYADTVTWAQGQAQEAIALYRRGRRASEQAVEAHNERVDAYNARIGAGQDPGPAPGPFRDPGKETVRQAREKLAEARRQRNTAASDAERSIRKALAHAPAEPPPLERIGNNLVDGFIAGNIESTHLVGGVVKGTAGLLTFVRGVNPVDPYNLTHPAEYLENTSMTLSGLVSTVAHPDRAVTAAVEGFKKDPSEFIGRLVPELLGTKGAGVARGGLRLAVREGVEGGVGTGIRDGVEAGARPRSPLDDATGTHRPDSPGEGFGYRPQVTNDVWDGLSPEQRHQVAAAELEQGARSFADPDAAISYGRDNWNRYVDDLPPETRQALRDYTGEPPYPGAPGYATYREMNGFLRGDPELGTPEVLNNIREVDRALAGNPLPEDVMVVRGSGVNHIDFDDVDDLVGRTVTDPAYTSTSLGNHPVPSFEGKEAVLRLRVPEGTHAAWVERVSDFGVIERELLLGRGMRYKVTRAFADDTGQLQIYGEVLPRD